MRLWYDKQGFLLPTAIIFVVLIGLMITFSSSIYNYSFNKMLQERRSTQAYYLAEAGISMAEYKIRDEKNSPSNNYEYPHSQPWFKSSTSEFSVGNSYKVWATKDASCLSLFTIYSKGESGNSSKVVSRIIREKVATSPFTGGKLIETKPGETWYVPDYRWPEYKFAPPSGLTEHSVALTGGIISGNHKYPGISLNKTTLTINGPANIHVTGNITLTKSTLVIGGTGPVNIYMAGATISCNNQSTITTKQSVILNLNGATCTSVSFDNTFDGTAPSGSYFLIMVSTDGYPPNPNVLNFTFKNKANLDTMIFAPDSTIGFQGSTNFENITGRVVAYNATGTGKDPADFIVDMTNATNITIGGYLQVKEWSEIN